MSGEPLFFVYGLLMSGGAGFQSLAMDKRACVIGPERINGLLYDLGEYPGLIRSKAAVVHGELVSITDSTLIEELDAYESYDPKNQAGSDYVRVLVPTLDAKLQAWTYTYNLPVEGFPLIVSGDWRCQ